MNRGAPALAADSGDVNCDETVNSVDALGVLRSTAGLSTPACSDAADVNCDDAVNAIDSLFILRFVAGLPVNLPDGCPPVGTSLGGPLLNEVLFLPAPGDDQFVELAGPGSLGGLTLVDESDQTYALPAGLPALAADDVLLIVFDGGNNVAGNVVHASPAGFLEGASGSVELRGGAGVLDRVAWGVEQPNAVPLSTGGMWGEPEPGLTIGRAPESTEVGPSAWHPFEPDDATPGSHNVQPAVDALLPFDGAVLPPGQVTLHWYPVAGAEEYQVQVSTSDTFASTALDDIVGGPEIQVTLSAGEYFWRVGAIGDGGIAVLSARETLGFETDLCSDVAPLNHLVAAMLAAGEVHALRDPTRGGLATTLNEVAAQSKVAVELTESAIPVHSAVRAACELLGFDPLYIANEGKLVACVRAEDAERIVQAMRRTPCGEEAVIVGWVAADPPGQVRLKTPIGGARIVDMLAGEMLPRIC